MMWKSDIKTELLMIIKQLFMMFFRNLIRKNQVSEVILSFLYVPLLNFAGRKFYRFHRMELWHIVEKTNLVVCWTIFCHELSLLSHRFVRTAQSVFAYNNTSEQRLRFAKKLETSTRFVVCVTRKIRYGQTYKRTSVAQRCREMSLLIHGNATRRDRHVPCVA